MKEIIYITFYSEHVYIFQEALDNYNKAIELDDDEHVIYLIDRLILYRDSKIKEITMEDIIRMEELNKKTSIKLEKIYATNKIDELITYLASK